MYKIIFNTHQISVTLFLIIYLIKTILLLSNNKEGLAKFTKGFKVPEMIVSFLFLATGIYMLTQIPDVKSFLLIKLVAVALAIPLAVVGFKKANKVLATSSLVLIFAAYGLAEMGKKHPEYSGSKAVAEAVSTVTDGKEIYTKTCSPCHGDDGKLGLTGATDLSASMLDKASAMEMITKGKSTMPPFANQLSLEQIEAVAEFIATLKKP